jgi:DNA end-binding protein Ku
MATTKTKTATAVEAAAVVAIVDNPKINLTPVRKEAKTSTFVGTLTAFGLMTIPVKTYKATDEDGVSFNQVHTCADGKVSQLKQGSMHCPCCDVDVAKTDIQKGYNLGNEKAPKFVTFSADEISGQKPSGDKTMELSGYVDATDIDPIFYESTEFIAADKGGEKAFATLLAGLKKTGKVAKGIRVKGGRQQEFVVRPYGQNGMAVSYLRTATEVREFNKIASVVTNPEEVELLATLIERYEDKFTPATEDQFLANVRRMVEAKAAGAAVTVPAATPDKAVTTDLMAALKASLAAAPKAKAAAAGK